MAAPAPLHTAQLLTRCAHAAARRVDSTGAARTARTGGGQEEVQVATAVAPAQLLLQLADLPEAARDAELPPAGRRHDAELAVEAAARVRHHLRGEHVDVHLGAFGAAERRCLAGQWRRAGRRRGRVAAGAVGACGFAGPPLRGLPVHAAAEVRCG